MSDLTEIPTPRTYEDCYLRSLIVWVINGFVLVVGVAAAINMFFFS
jgi:hypothetical protein